MFWSNRTIIPGPDTLCSMIARANTSMCRTEILVIHRSHGVRYMLNKVPSFFQEQDIQNNALLSIVTLHNTLGSTTYGRKFCFLPLHRRAPNENTPLPPGRKQLLLILREECIAPCGQNLQNGNLFLCASVLSFRAKRCRCIMKWPQALRCHERHHHLGCRIDRSLKLSEPVGCACVCVRVREAWRKEKMDQMPHKPREPLSNKELCPSGKDWRVKGSEIIIPNTERKECHAHRLARALCAGHLTRRLSQPRTVEKGLTRAWPVGSNSTSNVHLQGALCRATESFRVSVSWPVRQGQWHIVWKEVM